MTSGVDELDLDLRTGLPAALRVLLDEYPRAGWEADPGYSGLIEFWLDRHMMFRRLVERLRTDTERALDNRLEIGSYRQHLARTGSMFVQELHGHHSIEDQHYFPMLSRLDQRIQKGFELLDKDHHALDPLLGEFASRANTVLRPAPKVDVDAIAALYARIEQLDRLLDRHLIDEEELVVPVILKHGASGLA